VGGDAPALSLDDLGAWVEALACALRGERDAEASSARESARARFAWDASARRMPSSRIWRTVSGSSGCQLRLPQYTGSATASPPAFRSRTT